MWRAWLIWRLPPRLSRNRSVFDDHTGMGAVPLNRANVAGVGKRSTPAVSPRILAADRIPQPRMDNRDGPSWRTRGRRLRSRSLIFRLSSRHRSTRSEASSATSPCIVFQPGRHPIQLAHSPQATPPDMELGVELVEVPTKPVLEAGSFPHQSFPMVGQQAQLPGGTVETSHRKI